VTGKENKRTVEPSCAAGFSITYFEKEVLTINATKASFEAKNEIFARLCLYTTLV
jgi:hypothetical protein